MVTSLTAAEFQYASHRARAGLWIGPGFLVIACIAVVTLAGVLAPESRNVGRGLMMMVLVVSAMLHLGSFAEFIIVVRFLGHRPLPRSVLLLVGYWILLSLIVVVSVFAS